MAVVATGMDQPHPVTAMEQRPGQEAVENRPHNHDDAESIASELSTNDFHVDFQEDLLEALGGINASGSFASFGTLEDMEPRLLVKGIGEISLPLGVAQAQQLIKMARQAPYGKGSETIIDTSVRNTWELGDDQFEFLNPRWPGYVQKLCSRVAIDLGINSPINAHLYKMLIYEKGAMFKAHTDTEKIPGMFGTLVVCLPSPHQGGEVVVKHRGEKKTFKTSGDAWSFACWYSDVSHEVLPVTSGHRWVLTFNLTLDLAEERPSAGLQRSETRKLRHTLKIWLLEDQESRSWDHAYHTLDHEYTEASISLNALKSRDLAQVQCLRNLAADLPFEVFLAVLEKKEMGSCKYNGGYRDRYRNYDDEGDEDEEDEAGHHPLDDIVETTYRVKSLVDLKGCQVLSDVDLDEDNILDKSRFDDAEAEEEYEGYMGNYGPQATHWYRVTAALIVPQDSVVPFFNKAVDRKDPHDRGSMRSLVSYFANNALKHPAPGYWFTALQSQLEKVWKKPLYGHYGEEGMILDEDTNTRVLNTAVKFKNWPFFEKATSNLRGVLPLEYFTRLREQSAAAKVPFRDIRNGLSHAILSYPSFSDQCLAVSRFAPADLPMPDEVREWVRDTISKVLETLESRPLVGSDGREMVHTARDYYDLCFLSQTVAPLLEAKLNHAAFALQLLSELHIFVTRNIFPTEEGMRLYTSLAKSFITKLDISAIRSAEGIQANAANAPRYSYFQPRQVIAVDPVMVVGHESLADFCSMVIKMSSREDLITPLITKLVADTRTIDKFEFQPFWLPFLRALIPILETHAIPLSTCRYQQIFGAILEAYIENYVGREPTKGTNLARRTVACQCGDCSALNSFLANSQLQVGRFPVNKQRRGHLHTQLDSAGVDCTHVTERRGSPQTLVVTKTFKQNDLARREWAARRAQAGQQIKGFDQKDLMILLGQRYAKITGMGHLRAEEPQQVPGVTTTSKLPPRVSAPPGPLARLAQSTVLPKIGNARLSPRPAAGTKRKAEEAPEVIDLTGEEYD